MTGCTWGCLHKHTYMLLSPVQGGCLQRCKVGPRTQCDLCRHSTQINEPAQAQFCVHLHAHLMQLAGNPVRTCRAKKEARAAGTLVVHLHAVAHNLSHLCKMHSRCAGHTSEEAK